MIAETNGFQQLQGENPRSTENLRMDCPSYFLNPGNTQIYKIFNWFVCLFVFVGDFFCPFHIKAFFSFQKNEPIHSADNIGYGYAMSIQEPSLSELDHHSLT